MIERRLRFLAFCGSVLLLAAGNKAAAITIDQIQVGFDAYASEAKSRITIFKTEFWTSLRVDITNGPETLAQGDYVLVVETSDGDDMPCRFTERRLPTLQPGEQITLMTYVKPGSTSAEFLVLLQSSDGKKTFAKEKAQRATFDYLSSNSFLCLTAGSNLDGLNNALQKKPGAGPGESDEKANSNSRDNPVHLARAESVLQLPVRWLGYAGVDLVVLTASNERFISELAGDRTGRKEALAEWVRRGGRLVISAGQNQQYVGAFLKDTGLLDCPIEGSTTQSALVWSIPSKGFWTGLPSPLMEENRFNKPGHPVQWSQLNPGPGVDILIYGKTENSGGKDSETRPALVQGGAGLGRVMLAAFDLDQPPFTAWKSQSFFWTRLMADFGIRTLLSSAKEDLSRIRGYSDSNNELAGVLANGLEAFEDVPVISFGWVALFIVLYILVVGPLDYWFLKKVVKRLEFTWITFPVIVLVISVASYYTAYYLKGDELRINKVDVVDFNLTDGQVQGSTWFTLFSPRIQNFTIGIDPAADTWSAAAAPAATGVVVENFDRPESPDNPRFRTGSQSLFGQEYHYAPSASGLVGVPIQVWSTKSFRASWQGAMLPRFVEADLRPAKPNSDELVFQFTSHMPVSLEAATLIYRNKMYSVSNAPIAPGTAIKPLTLNSQTGGSDSLSTWLASDSLGIRMTYGRANRAAPQVNSANKYPMKGIWFFDSAARRQVDNTGLRYLDESWRIRHDRVNEAVLVARVSQETSQDRAEKLAEAGIAPTRLWLGRLPGGSERRPELPGMLEQETFVRFFIPVKR